MNNAKLKAKARKSLSKSYWTLLSAMLILVGLGLVCSLIANLISAPWIAPILGLIVDALFMLGFIKMISKAAKNRKVKIEDLFSETELFFKYLGVFIIIFVLISVLCLLAMIAFKSLGVVITYQAEINFGLSVFLIAFGLILTVVILLAIIYLSIAFSQVLFILNDNPKKSVSEVLSRSFDMMEDYIVDYFLLIFSFIGWMILGIFTFGLLYLWLVPYMLVTCANFYEKIKKEYDSEKDLPKLFNNKDTEEAIKDEK